MRNKVNQREMIYRRRREEEVEGEKKSREGEKDL